MFEAARLSAQEAWEIGLTSSLFAWVWQTFGPAPQRVENVESVKPKGQRWSEAVRIILTFLLPSCLKDFEGSFGAIRVLAEARSATRFM